MSVSSNIERVREKIHAAEIRTGRATGSVRLMAVSKFHSAESVSQAIGAGLTLFGENRVQEACTKFPEIVALHPETEIHLIGTLQRNKVKPAVSLVSCIQSVDRAELLAEIEKHASALNRTVSVLFEYHTGEESKSGYTNRDSLFRSIDLLADFPHIHCSGLMTIAPFTSDRNRIRESFNTLVALQKECKRSYPLLSFDELSMGMSSDFEIAIEEGSTLVRIGSAIFGERT